MKKTLTATGIGSLMVMGAVDASMLNETPIERVEVVARERVESRQVGNVVETTLPWKDATPLKISYDLGNPTVAERATDKRKQEVITETVDFGDGGFKVDILLNERPQQNRFCYTIQNHQDYDFFYQPELTPEEIADGAERPEEIVGSYAVYHKSKRDNEYRTGKVMHITRPQVWEVNNKASTTIWADLSYTPGQLCVTVDRDYLDAATYPVRVDPTFGYTSVGGSGHNIGADDIYGISVTPSEAGTVDSITVYNSQTDGNFNWKGVLSEATGLTIVSNGVTPASASISDGTLGWRTINYSSSPSITAQEYFLGFIHNVSDVQYVYDSSSNHYRDPSNSYTTPTDPTDALPYTRQYSIYATYTADAPAEPTVTTFSEFEGDVVFEGDVLVSPE